MKQSICFRYAFDGDEGLNARKDTLLWLGPAPLIFFLRVKLQECCTPPICKKVSAKTGTEYVELSRVCRFQPDLRSWVSWSRDKCERCTDFVVASIGYMSIEISSLHGDAFGRFGLAVTPG